MLHWTVPSGSGWTGGDWEPQRGVPHDAGLPAAAEHPDGRPHPPGAGSRPQGPGVWPVPGVPRPQRPAQVQRQGVQGSWGEGEPALWVPSLGLRLSKLCELGSALAQWHQWSFCGTLSLGVVFVWAKFAVGRARCWLFRGFGFSLDWSCLCCPVCARWKLFFEPGLN